MGYAEGHSLETFQVLNPKARNINLINDVIFINKSYGEFNKADYPVIVQASNEGLDDEDNDQCIFINNRNNNDDVMQLAMIQKVKTLKKKLK